MRSETVIRDIFSIKEALGVIVCKNLLFIHAIAGCDTTSGLFGIGKGSPLKMFKENEHFRKNARKFNKDNSTSKEIMEAGEILLSHPYKGKGTEDLNKMRYNMFCEKLVTLKSQVEPQMLPPTSDAAKYHNLRVYYQIREWKGNGEDMDPLLWGWKLVEGRLMPKSMDLMYAPVDLLFTIRCNCKSGCVNLRCSCKKHGLPCSTACGEYQGVSCANADSADLTDKLETVS